MGVSLRFRRIWRHEALVTHRYGPETVTAYNESTYAVTLDGDKGVVQVFEYYDSGDEKGQIKKYRTKVGSDTGPENDPITHLQYAYETTSNAMFVKEVGPNTTGVSDDENWLFTLSFWDGSQEQLKEFIVESPKIITSHNGPNARSTTKTWIDSWGRVRWLLDAEGGLAYTGYDDNTGVSGDKTGRVDLVVRDVSTAGSNPVTISNAAIDADWDGTTYGFSSDDVVPYARSRADKRD